MKSILSLITALVLSTSASNAQRDVTGSGRTINDARNVGEFHSIGSTGSATVDVYPSSKARVEVSGYENLVPVFETEVNNGTLTLHFKDGIGNVRNSNIRVKIYTPGVRRIGHAGSGDITVHPGATVLVRVVDVAGSGKVTLNQSDGPELALSIAGSGDINARGARATKVIANIAGSGEIETAALTDLKASITGSGDIHYWGEPKVSKAVIGSGSVVQH